MKHTFAAIGRCDRASSLTELARAALCMALAAAAFTACQPADDEAAGSSTVEGAAGEAAQMPATPDARLERQIGLMNELRDIDAALAPVRSRAQENPEIRAEERELVALVDEAMEEIRPGVLEDRARFESLRQEYMTAQQSEDQERLQALGAELEEVQNGIQEVQAAALEQEAVAEAVEAFREELFEWMRAADPQADSLLQRAQEITEILEGMAPAADG